MPIDISIKYAKLPNGLVYFYQHWIPENPKALVVFIHGLGDHCGRYDELLQRFVSKGCATATYDQRGHGRSAGKRGHIDRFGAWVDDLTSFVNFSLGKVPEGTPLFIVGHSLGALIGINYLLTHAQRVTGMVSVSAAFAPDVDIPNWKRKLAVRLDRIVPKLTVCNGVMKEDLTRDTDELAAIKNDALFHDRLTIAAGREIASNLEIVGGFPQRIHAPMLLVAGSSDKVCKPDATRWFADRLATIDKQCRIYDGMYHDLFHDIGRETVLDDVSDWVLTRAAEAVASKEQYLLQRGEEIWENVSQSF